MTSLAESVPSAPGRLPLVGHALSLWRRPTEFLQSLRSVGDIVRIQLGPWPVYVLVTPGLVHEVLVTQARSFDKGRLFERTRPLFGNGLVTSDGEFHRRQRRLMQPAFHHARIDGYVEIMGKHARHLVGSWQPGQVVSVHQELYSLALTMVTGTMFSSDLGRSAIAEVQRCLPVIVNGALAKAVTPTLLDRLIPANRRFNTASRRLRGVIDDVIRDYRASGADHADLLSMLMSASPGEDGGPMTDTQIRDELVNIMVAGTETTATTLAWTFYELGRHPEVERRVQAEIDAVVGTEPIGSADVPRLEYTGRVLTEVTRLHSGLLLMRRATTEVEIGGFRVPAGTEFAFSQYALHRDPRLFPAPTRFDPDRWLPEHADQVPRDAFIPFGAGNRKCIGDSFAGTEMAIAVATIAAQWQLQPLPGHTVREVATNFPRPDALPMTAVPRHT